MKKLNIRKEVKGWVHIQPADKETPWAIGIGPPLGDTVSWVFVETEERAVLIKSAMERALMVFGYMLVQEANEGIGLALKELGAKLLHAAGDEPQVYERHEGAA